MLVTGACAHEAMSAQPQCDEFDDERAVAFFKTIYHANELKTQRERYKRSVSVLAKPLPCYVTSVDFMAESERPIGEEFEEFVHSYNVALRT